MESAVAPLPREPGAAARTLGGESVRGGLEGGDRGHLSPPSVVRVRTPAVSTPAGDGLLDELDRRLPLDEHVPESLRKRREMFLVPSDDELHERAFEPLEQRLVSPQLLINSLVVNCSKTAFLSTKIMG